MSTKILDPDFSAQLNSAGLQLTEANFIKKIIEIPDDLNKLSLFHYIVLTSKTSVAAWMEIIAQLQLTRDEYKIFCLENATHDAANRNGLTIAGSASNASLLADEILKDKSITSVSFVCSDIRREELPSKLRKHGVRVHELKAYKTMRTPVKIEEPYDGIIFFSPSAVESFTSVNSTSANVTFCLGKTTATQAASAGFKNIQIAPAPTQKAIIKTILTHYNKPPLHA